MAQSYDYDYWIKKKHSVEAFYQPSDQIFMLPIKMKISRDQNEFNGIVKNASHNPREKNCIKLIALAFSSPRLMHSEKHELWGEQKREA